MKGKKVLFLDRDGVIVNETQVDSYERIVYIPHVFEALRRLRRESDYSFVMVSNQDGVGTPSFLYEDYKKCQDRIISTLEGEDIYFDDINVDFSLPEDNCPTRKPSALMVDSYKRGEYDLSSSFMVGDRISDMLLAKNIGCKGILLNKDVDVPDELKDTVAFVSDSWLEILSFLLPDSLVPVHRKASIDRKTNETDISLSIDLDGTGKGKIVTGIGFFDHMLSQIVRHSRYDIIGKLKGDFEVDEHHSVEDLAIALGSLISKALGDKRGIERYGYEILTMDDVVATVALDFSGRPGLIYDVDIKREYIGTFPTEMIKHFFKSFSDSAKMNLYIKVTDGNSHHQAEAVFKAFARALRHASKRIPGAVEISSTKGVL